MIVQPDFPDHWKTARLIELTGEPTAPIAVIRLWGHCQNRKAWEFDGMGPDTLKAVCHWQKEARPFFDAMKKSGFIDVKARSLTVHNWAEVNASLIASWGNGKKSKGPKGAHRTPTDNPQDTPVWSDKTDKTDQMKKIDKTDQIKQTEERGADGEDAQETPLGSESENARAGEILSSRSVIESVRFLCSGSKSKPATKTLEELSGKVSEDRAKAICRQVYAMKLAGALRKEAGAMLTSMLMEASIEEDGKPNSKPIAFASHSNNESTANR